jgi:hypothetical protein
MTEPVPTTHLVVIPPATDPNEAQLTKEVGVLWQVHSQAQISLSKSRGEMKVIRADLSQHLHQLKAALSKPGRGGAWSSFLAMEKIPRSSADRLVRTHERTLAPQAGNCVTEHISEPAEVKVRRYVHAVWPKLSRILTTPSLVELFVDELQRRADKSFNTTPQVPSGS